MPAPIHVTEQAIGSGIAYINSERLKHLSNDLQRIVEERSSFLELQDEAFVAATKEIEKLRNLLGDPAHILGSDKTKHGEIAEFLEVHIRRAQDFVNQRAASATFEGVPRTGSADYILNGIEVQSKFINGTNNSLKHVLEHMENYSNFGRDGSYYQVPKDQFEIISKIIKGEHIEGLSLNSQIAIQNKVAEVEQLTGKAFSDVIKPSISNYSEVQQGVVFKTVEGHEQNIGQQYQDSIKKIYEDAKHKESIAQDSHYPSIGEAGKAAGMGALISGALSLTMGIRKKLKEGKKLAEFTSDDWKELGLDTAQASAKGGITGAALYGLTNFTEMSSPVAAALISSTFGVASIYKRYKRGEIPLTRLYEETQLTCVDSTIVALGATIGSMLIPIPVLGALVGSSVANIANGFLRNWLSDNEQKEVERLNKDYQDYVDKLDARLKAFIDKVMKKYEKLNELVGMAFNYEADVFIRLDASINFARQMGVSEARIIKDKGELDSYLGY